MKLNVLIETAKENNGFISKDCECHFTIPYGFVPEADCKKHDNKSFVETMGSKAEQVLGEFD